MFDLVVGQISYFFPCFSELSRLDLQTGRFTLRQMKAATGNFDSKNKIGEGGFGPVYKVCNNFSATLLIVCCVSLTYVDPLSNSLRF